MYIMGIDPTRVDTTAKWRLGSIGANFDGGFKVYKYVEIKNATATVAGVAGDVVAYFAEVGASTGRVVTDKTDADSVVVGAGVLGAAVAGVLAVAEYAWIQIKGPATLNTAIGDSAADGDQLMAGATDLALQRMKYTGTSPNIVPVGPCVAICNDTTAKLVSCDFPY